MCHIQALTALHDLTALYVPYMHLAAVRDAQVLQSLGDLLMKATRHRRLAQAGFDLRVSHFPHKFVNLPFTLVIVKDKLTDLWGS